MSGPRFQASLSKDSVFEHVRKCNHASGQGCRCCIGARPHGGAHKTLPQKHHVCAHMCEIRLHATGDPPTHASPKPGRAINFDSALHRAFRGLPGGPGNASCTIHRGPSARRASARRVLGPLRFHMCEAPPGGARRAPEGPIQSGSNIAYDRCNIQMSTMGLTTHMQARGLVEAVSFDLFAPAASDRGSSIMFCSTLVAPWPDSGPLGAPLCSRSHTFVEHEPRPDFERSRHTDSESGFRFAVHGT
jgi:hypothetical protein